MTDSTDNILDLNAFRKKKNAAKPRREMSEMLEQFVEAHHEAGPEATDMYDKALMLFKAYGFETDDFTHQDLLLLRESLFSIIIRYRGGVHPLHSFADEFDKYFNRIEYFLDSEWQSADDDPDDNGPNLA